MHDAALEPLGAGLVAGVGGPDVLADLLDDGEQLRVLAGVEARPQLARPRPAPRPVRGRGPALALGQRGARGHGLVVEAADVVVHLLQLIRYVAIVINLNRAANEPLAFSEIVKIFPIVRLQL